MTNLAFVYPISHNLQPASPEPESESEPEVEPVKKVKKVKSVPEPRPPVKVEKFGYDNFVLFN